MEDWLRFSVVYWHTFRGVGLDPFGAPTIKRPWDDGQFQWNRSTAKFGQLALTKICQQLWGQTIIQYVVNLRFDSNHPQNVSFFSFTEGKRF